jgi:hypothetical protein
MKSTLAAAAAVALFSAWPALAGADEARLLVAWIPTLK